MRDAMEPNGKKNDNNKAGTKRQRRRNGGDRNSGQRKMKTTHHHSTVEVLPWSLACRKVSNVDLHPILWWESKTPPVPIHAEEALIPLLMQYGKRERGMFRKQPAHRLRKVRQLCQQHDVPLKAALSLRRHHIKQHNISQSMTQLGLGNVTNINACSRVFEVAVASCLEQYQVSFYSEDAQRAYSEQHRPAHETRRPVTPDFILHEPWRIKVYYNTHDDKQTKQKQQRILLHERSVHWIEAKMFYGASTIPPDGRSAVGTLLTTAEKYVRFHGPGAMIFMQGFGDRLAEQLLARGVLPLDCSCNVSLQPVEDHQRTWCADADGTILP